jgi:hypothetical protein
LSRELIRGPKGRFVEADKPPMKKFGISMPEPLLKAIDKYAKEKGIGRSKAINELLTGVIQIPEPLPIETPAEKHLVQLQLVKRSNPIYQQYRNEHYIKNKGAVGQGFDYLILYAGETVGIISGASDVYTTKPRDEFFGLSNDKDTKNMQLNSLVNNNVFRLERRIPNLASIVLKTWRKRIAQDWEYLYGVPVAGFTTFIIESRLDDTSTRNGACYRSDNWTLCGITTGYSGTNTRGREVKKSLEQKKLVYCRKVNGVPFCSNYKTSWFDYSRQKELKEKREQMIEDSKNLLCLSSI